MVPEGAGRAEKTIEDEDDGNKRSKELRISELTCSIPMSEKPSIVWFRLDLRLADNPALAAASKRGRAVVPVFIWSPDEEGDWAPGAASRWWLHQSLRSLDASLRKRGSSLVIRKGSTLAELRKLLKETGANAVFWNRRYEPSLIQRDTGIKKALQEDGLQVESFNSALLLEPWEIKNASGKPFQVFTPFWRACLAKLDKVGGASARRPNPAGAPTLLPHSLKSIPLPSLELEPRIPWDKGMRETWKPGEAGAKAQLDRFAREALCAYSRGRNRPDLIGTSRLSPHLHFGEIGLREVWEVCSRASGMIGNVGGASARRPANLIRFGRRTEAPPTVQRQGLTIFLSELGWREFAHHLLFYFPHTPEEPLRSAFKKFPWTKDAKGLKAWQQGRTGYPLVDAGMRELWTTGWMHNRVRMVVASFLVKDLLLPWQEGAKWFWDTLVDGDLANNTLGWQWTAGCGADAAPYFRVFNPVSQGEKFDPNGDYVRRWVPELAKLPAKWIHKPWEAPPDLLQQARVALGRTYPKPIVSHTIARMRALAAYDNVKRKGAS